MFTRSLDEVYLIDRQAGADSGFGWVAAQRNGEQEHFLYTPTAEGHRQATTDEFSLGVLGVEKAELEHRRALSAVEIARLLVHADREEFLATDTASALLVGFNRAAYRDMKDSQLDMMTHRKLRERLAVIGS